MTCRTSCILVLVATLWSCRQHESHVTVVRSERRSAEVVRELIASEERVRAVASDWADVDDEDAPLEATAHERKQYRRVLTREVAAIDERIEELEAELEEATDDAKPAKRHDLHEGRAWRHLLRQDLHALDKAAARSWRSLKRKISRDLEEARPESFPVENAYGI